MKSKDIKSELDKVHDLIEKVAEMATRGDEHEKDVASEKLDRLLKKYNIRLEEIENRKKSKRTFRVANKSDCLTIMCQTIWDIVPEANIRESNRKLEVYASMTNEQYIDVCEKFEYYWKLWCKDKEEYLTAFVITNKLGIRVKSSGIDKDEKTLNGIRSKIHVVAKGEYVNRNQKQIN